MNMFWGHETQRQQQQQMNDEFSTRPDFEDGKREGEKEKIIHESALKMCKIEIRDLWPVIINL